MNEENLRLIIQDFVNQVKEVLNTLPKTENKQEGLLSKRALLELVSHEGIVQEAYKDSRGIWTWGIGVTNQSGHRVDRYIDNPQPLKKVIEIFKWLVETKYLPDVLEAFKGVDLTEEQLAAAVSFHYNTGAIKRASWVKSFKAGNIVKARTQFMDWKSPKEIIPRREAERDLFFSGIWSNKGTTTVFTRVRKPSYVPVWGSATKVDITGEL